MLHLLLVLLAVAPVHARSAGITGRATSGCGGSGCHGTASTSTTTATLSATSRTLAPGATTAVTLRVATTSTTRTHAGLNVSATGGTLSAGSNTIKSGSEITQSSARAMTSGAITFRFSWTAPSTPGTYTINASGNAVNNNGATSGDGWRVASGLTMTVSSSMVGEEAEVEDLETGDLEAEELPEDALDEVSAWADGAEEEPVDLAGCSTAGGGAGGVLGIGAVAGLVARRRRQAGSATA